jgi:hypothetical protein
MMTQATTDTVGAGDAGAAKGGAGEQLELATDAAKPDAAAQAPAAKTDGKPIDAKPEPAKAEGADLDIKLPEGWQVDEVVLKEFKSSAKELGLKGEGAQKLMDLYAKAQTSAAEKHQAARAEQLQTWVETAKADKEFGGDGLKANLAVAERALARFGTPALKEFLNETGLNNYPELVRLLVRAGKGMGEDTIKGSVQGGGAAKPTEAERYAQMYPKTKF